MEEQKLDIKKEVLKYINVEGLLGELLLEKVIIKALDKVAADSENKIDDIVIASLKPVLIKEAKEAIADLIKKLQD